MQPEALAESLARTIKGLLDPLAARVAALESYSARVEGYTAFLQRDLQAADARIAELEARPPGRDGVDGKDGRPGKDGAPGMEYKGAYVPGAIYGKGDTVTVDGSMFTCRDAETSEAPGKSRAWTLSVKHGQDLRPKGGDRG